MEQRMPHFGALRSLPYEETLKAEMLSGANR